MSMELNGVITFIGIFISILLVSISMAYYGIFRQQDDILPDISSTIIISKKPKKTSSNFSSSNSSKQQQNNRDLSTKSSKEKQQVKQKDNETKKVEKIEQEEEPIVIIPDPFTKQINSRFAPQLKNNNYNINNNNYNANTGINLNATKKEQIDKRTATTTNHQLNVQLIGNLNGAYNKKEENAFNFVNSNNLHANGQYTVNNTSTAVNGSVCSSHNNKIFEKSNTDKVKPKATVKPNQAIMENQQQQTKSINQHMKQQQLLSNKFHLKPTINQFETSTSTTTSTNDLPNETDKIKIQELTVSLNEKLKQCELLNAINTKLQNEVNSLNSRMKDLESLKTTNMIIQQEIAKQSVKCVTLEKERNQLDDKFKNEIESYKKNEISLIEKIKILESLKISEKTSEINTNMERQISYLQNELSDIQKRFKESEESYLNKIKELSSHLMGSENQLKDLQRDKQGYQMKWEESIEINKRLNDHIKDIDAKLSSSLCLINEFKMNENHFEAQNKLLQAKQEAELASLRDSLESKNRDIENLKNLNRSLIEKLEISKQHKQENGNHYHNQLNGKSDELIMNQMFQLKEKEIEIIKLNANLQESNEMIKKFECQNKSLNDQLATFEKKIKDLEKLAETLQKTVDDYSNKKNDDKSLSYESDKRLNELISELDKEKGNVKDLQSKLDAKQKKVNELKEKLADAKIVNVKELTDEIESLRLKNSKLKSIWETAESSMENLEKIIESTENHLNNEINFQKSLVNDLRSKNTHEIADLKKKLDIEINARKELEAKLKHDTNKKITTNGSISVSRYPHQNEDFDEIVTLKSELDKLKTENESLRHIIDEETKSGKLADRNLLRNIIKKGQEAFEKEKIVIEKFEEKLESQ